MPVSTANFSSQLLIALPALDDPNFARSVALICQHDEEGAMGVVVNRASEYSLGDVLAQMNLQTDDPLLANQIVLNGGPVHPERGFVLHDGGRQWDSTLDIGGGLALTTSRDILEALAEGAGPEHVVVALGCAGWGAGQLEFELGENSWLTAPADNELLFALPLERRWQAAGCRLGIDITRVTDYSGHA
ncbi:MAG: YqgE/AlgH family protein [Oxalobacteraceae bacterium]|nr:MAG: YqgE/AlgH family protein [Oxalobacteraceae bacterium]